MPMLTATRISASSHSPSTGLSYPACLRAKGRSLTRPPIPPLPRLDGFCLPGLAPGVPRQPDAARENRRSVVLTSLRCDLARRKTSRTSLEEALEQSVWVIEGTHAVGDNFASSGINWIDGCPCRFSDAYLDV